MKKKKQAKSKNVTQSADIEFPHKLFVTLTNGVFLNRNATPGPWGYKDKKHPSWMTTGEWSPNGYTYLHSLPEAQVKKNQAFVVWAREETPKLIRALLTGWATIAEVRNTRLELLHRFMNDGLGMAQAHAMVVGIMTGMKMLLLEMDRSLSLPVEEDLGSYIDKAGVVFEGTKTRVTEEQLIARQKARRKAAKKTAARKRAKK